MTPAALYVALEIATAVWVRDPRPGAGGPALVHTASWSLGELHGAELTLRACAVSTDPVLGTKTVYPPGFVAAAPVDHTRIERDGDRLAVGPWTSVLGAADTDFDGHPGVTVHVQNVLLGRGDVYISQRSITRLEGVVAPDGTASGRAMVDTAQSLLGASSWWLKIPTSPRPDPDSGRFRLVPIAEGTCAAVAVALRRATVATD